MLIKFETKSARVKGLSFHPRRRWLLAGLHNGVIQLWDYSERTMMDKFDEHKGPVRGLDFHKHQPLFVSGADDSKIKVWNYKTRRCLFSLDAHEDYIRTTFFHHEHPWILSCSDDQSIRIWNWQSRTRIAVLTGHTHYVLCAQFHPKNELILSSSIDTTLRLWDITGLKMKSSSSTRDEISNSLPEILTKTDFSVEQFDAHDREVNWCAFHPDPAKELCLSCGDDNNVKIWRIDSRGGLREVDTLKGHYNNVNCAIFHPRKNIALSASDDRSVRVWDLDKRTASCTHRRETDRIWVLAAHPNENLFAAGHDSGVMLFKLERERPAFTITKDYIIFIRDKQLLRYSMKATRDDVQKESVLGSLKPKTELSHYYRRIHSYSYDGHSTTKILVSVRSTNVEKSVYDCYTIGSSVSDEPDSFRSPGLTAIFIGPNRSAILDKSNRVIFKMNNQESKSKITIKADDIFFAGAGRLFVKSKVNDCDTISLWDVERDSPLCSMKVDAKYVVMSDNKQYVACVGSNKIVICDGQLNILSTVHESRKIKSAAWNENGILIYSTPVHIKYALADGDSTTILTVQHTLYVMAARDNKLFCIDRNGKVLEIPVDAKEFRFKQAVIKNDRGAIIASLRQMGTLSREEISFLVKKGHPGLALKFVKDPKTRFSLALQAFDIDVALEAAREIDDVGCWQQLADIAPQVGHWVAAEAAYIRLEKPYKLAMLYLVCNQRDKMLEARELAAKLNDSSTGFIISLLLKDFTECTNIIRKCGYPNLAYTCAINHGLHDLAKEISMELTEDQLSRLPSPDKTRPQWMNEAILSIGNSKFENWPMLNDESENFEAVVVDENRSESEAELDDNGDWESENEKSELEEMADAQSGGWDDDEPLEELQDEEEVSDEEDVGPDAPVESKWTTSSNPALHFVLARSYKKALNLLGIQIGVVEVGPLKDIFRDLFMRTRCAYQNIPIYPTVYQYPVENLNESQIPMGGYRIVELEKRRSDCYNLFSSGKFSDAIIGFRNLLLSTIFMQVYVSSSDLVMDEQVAKSVAEAKKIIATSREYIIGSQIWLERKNIKDSKRACELAAYFASLDLSKHKSKILEHALKVFLTKPKEFQKTSAARSIATRLENYLNPDNPEKAIMLKNVKKVISSFDARVDQEMQLEYDDLNPYNLCAASFKPIYRGNQVVSCPLCDAKYNPTYKGQACKVCLVSEIGRKCSGIQFEMANFEDF